MGAGLITPGHEQSGRCRDLPECVGDRLYAFYRRGICGRPDEDKIIIHHVVTVYKIAFPDGLELLLLCMDKDHVRVSRLPISMAAPCRRLL